MQQGDCPSSQIYTTLNSTIRLAGTCPSAVISISNIISTEQYLSEAWGEDHTNWAMFDMTELGLWKLCPE